MGQFHIAYPIQSHTVALSIIEGTQLKLCLYDAENKVLRMSEDDFHRVFNRYYTDAYYSEHFRGVLFEKYKVLGPIPMPGMIVPVKRAMKIKEDKDMPM